MKRLSTIAVCAFALPLIVAASAGADKDGVKLKPAKAAAQQCAAEKKADKNAFRATYGKHAMRDCIRAGRGEADQAVENASQQCRAERDADPAAFAETYGTNGNSNGNSNGNGNGNGKNAFGKCVSGKVHEHAEQAADEFDNAARECRDERSADPDAFAETYGSNHNRRNAFGKCVSQKAHETEGDSAA